MYAEAQVAREVDAPPPSGVRIRVALPSAAPLDDRLVLAEVGEQVFFETWNLVRVLSPLQGAWFRLGLAPLAAAVLDASAWSCGHEKPTAVLRRRWPELVPGVAALDRLAHLMVDALCD